MAGHARLIGDLLTTAGCHAVSAPARGINAIPWLEATVVLAAYVVALLFSGPIVRTAMRSTNHDAPLKDESTAKSGKLIGKCENILIVTLVLLDAFTALALIFTAKSLVKRAEGADAEYLLGGTLVNVTWSIMVALAARWSLSLLQ